MAQEEESEHSFIPPHLADTFLARLELGELRRRGLLSLAAPTQGAAGQEPGWGSRRVWRQPALADGDKRIRSFPYLEQTEREDSLPVAPGAQSGSAAQHIL